MATRKDLRRTRIKRAIRAKIAGTAERPRLTVYRSNSAMYAQVVDDLSGKTLFSATSFVNGKQLRWYWDQTPLLVKYQNHTNLNHCQDPHQLDGRKNLHPANNKSPN